MPISAFDDKSREPGPAQLGDALGPAEVLWKQLLARASRRDPAVVHAWHYAGPKYGWSLRVKLRDRTLLHMTPCKGFFLAGVVLGERAVAAARARRAPTAVLAALEAAPRYAEGRGIRTRVSTTRDLRLVIRLLELKMT